MHCLEPPKGLAVAAPSVVLEGLARRGDGLADDDAFRRVDAVQVAHQRQPRPLEHAARVLEFGARVAIYSIQAQRGAELLLVGVAEPPDVADEPFTITQLLRAERI